MTRFLMNKGRNKLAAVLICVAGLCAGSRVVTADHPSPPPEHHRDTSTDNGLDTGHGVETDPAGFLLDGLFALKPAVEIGHPPPSEPGSRRAKPKNGSKTTFDPDARTSLTFQATPELSLGGKINLELKSANNDDLDSRASDRLTLLESKLSLAVLYQPTPQLELFAETRVSYSNPLTDGADRRNEETEVEFREGYVLLKNAPAEPISLQVGRQRFKDDREWIYDERLDAVRLVLDKDPLTLELSISSTIVDPDKNEDKITNYIAHGTYQYARKASVSLYGIAREDRSVKDRDPVYVGLSWSDRSNKTDKFWLDAAALLGHDRSKDLLGYGLDVGWSHRFDQDLKPSLTLGYALGSGDPDPKDGRDRAFQQTDLHDNSGKFFGITKFNYYGQVFDPELSNMMIFTAGVGIAPSKSFSLDLVYHYYALVEFTDELRDADVVEDLVENDRDLGHELDLIIGLKLTEKIRTSLTAGIFLPGSAFSRNDIAYGVEFKMQIPF